MNNIENLIGTYDFLFITLDSLRYDVACNAIENKSIPNLAKLLPKNKWEKRHTLGNFTLPAHCAFFYGFLPRKIKNSRHIPKFPNIEEGFGKNGYLTICIGGVGFFNKKNYLGHTLPQFFHESYWSPQMGVNSYNSTEIQIDYALERLKKIPKDKRVFLFVNISAIHQPSFIYLKGAKRDSIKTQEAALKYVDKHLPKLFYKMQKRAPVFVIICSDHGELFGEDGLIGHGISHKLVWEIPYGEFILPEIR